MSRFTAALFAALFAAFPDAVPPAAATPFQVTEIAPDLLLLATDQGSYSNNSLVFKGPEGVLLVDTHAGADAGALKAFVDSLASGPPRWIVNTHRHVEHIGGNAVFGADPVGVAHASFPARLRSGTFLFSEYPPEVFPEITFTDSLTLRFNGEVIRLVAIAGSHDDNEIMVHFTRHGVAHVSSVVNGFNFPSVDDAGDALRFADMTERLMALLPRDVRIVSGHHGRARGFGELGAWDELPAYLEMLRGTEAIVRRELGAGRTLEQMQADDVLGAYSAYAGSYVGTAEWTEYLADAVTGPRKRGEDICAPVFRTWKDAGAEAAVARYRDLVRTDAGRWDDDEFVLLGIGSKLRGRGLNADALVFLRGSLEVHPEARYAFYAHYLAARCCVELDRTGEAIDHARTAVRLGPDFTPAAELLAGLADGGARD